MASPLAADEAVDAPERSADPMANGDVSSWPEADVAWTQSEVRFPGKRWGNRPAILWIAVDLGCCASG
jgi:hypothetical protein